MKKSFLFIGAAFLLMAGCKEVGPAIDFGTVESIDTAYILPPDGVPAAAAHNVLVEDFTGQSCPNCIAADANLTSEAGTHANLNIISMFPINTPQTVPPAGSVHDLRDTDAYTISTNTFYEPIQVGLPCVGVDRVSGSLSSGIWDVAITSQSAVTDSVNLTIQSSYNTTTAMATTTVTVTYTQGLGYQHNLNIALVEDSIYDLHEAEGGGDVDSFLYMNVFRGMVTPGTTGVPVSYTGYPSSEPGGLYWRQVYTYALPLVFSNPNIPGNPAIVPSHCRVVAYLVNSSNGCIAQSAQAYLGAYY